MGILTPLITWSRRYGWRSLALACAYLAVGWLGTLLAMPPGYATAVFPASGIALAALLFFRSRLWPGILLGSFCLNFWISSHQLPDFSFPAFLPVGLGIGLGATGEALAAAWFIRRWTGSGNPLNRVKDVFIYLLAAGALSCAISATVGVSSLCLGGITEWLDFGANWLTWWLGDVVGILVVTPLLLHRVRPLDFKIHPIRIGEALLLCGLLLGTSGLIFWTSINPDFYSLIFLILPPMVWAAFRFGQSGASCSVLLVSGIAISGTIQGQGPFAAENIYQSLLLLQAFMAVTWVMTQTLAAAVWERNLAQIAFRASEERLSLVLGATTQGVWDWNLVTNEVFFSPWWIRSLGYDPEEIKPHLESWKKLVHPEDMPRVMDKLNAYFEGRTTDYECENRLLKKSGEWRWNLDRGKVVEWDASGKPVRMVGVDIDITELKRVEFALRESRALFQTLARLSPVGIFRADARGLCLYVNERWCEISGLSLEQAGGEGWANALHPDDRKKVLKGWAKCAAENLSFKMEYRFLRDDGKVTWVLGQAEIEKDPDGKINGYVGTITDITERKHEEERIIQNRDQLEFLVKEKTKHLELEKERAEKASQAKSEFLARMSHELRTPMNSILGFTQLLQMDSQHPLPAYQKEFLNMVSNAGNHLLGLINEVLDLAKIESGELDLTTQTIDLFQVLDDAISLSKPLADQKSISLEFQWTGDQRYFVEANSMRMKQVFLNLISNGIKYNRPNGSVTISVIHQDNENIRVNFEDTGYGVPKDRGDRLFEPFDRLDANNTEIEGTGIGLTIAKRLIEMMNGTIGFESDVGVGSCFYVEMPVSDKTAITPRNVEEPVSRRTNNPVGNKKKILYFEDIFDNVELVRQILLRRAHIQLLSASNAQEGIDFANSHSPDLILMDIHLPGMDGLTAFKKLNGNPQTKSIPVIALTADAMNADIKRAMDMGFHSYITKPIDVPRFLETIDSILA